MINFKSFCKIIFLGVLVNCANANTKDFDDFFNIVNKIDNLNAKYTLTSGKKVSVGEIWLQRPMKMKVIPNNLSENIILIDGKEFFDYDADLDQVLIRPVKDLPKYSPVNILLGDKKELVNEFNIELKDNKIKNKTFELTPKSSKSEFDLVTISFKYDKPYELTIIDAANQKIKYKFDKLVINQKSIPDQVFTLKLDDDVDVIRVGY